MEENKDLFIFFHLQRAAGSTLHDYFEKEFSRDEFIHLREPTLKAKERRNPFEKRPEEIRKKAKIISGHAVYKDIVKFVPEKNPKYITILRDPASRAISRYNKRMRFEGKEMPFNEWCKGIGKNSILEFYYRRLGGRPKRIPEKLVLLNKCFPGGEKRLAILKNLIRGLKKNKKSKRISPKEKLKKVKDFLDKCWFVGTLETYDKDIDKLVKKMGGKNPIKEKHINKTLNKKLKLTPLLKAKIYKENPFDVELYEYAKKLNKEKRNNLI